jgi:hypothetical protein
MLSVYTYPIPKPADCYDMSRLSLEDGFIDAIKSIVSHQKGGTIWLGYLEGWMLTPMEEVILRKALRNFHCIVVSRFPLSFSQAWKNEIDWVYTVRRYHGEPNTNNNGRFVHDGSEAEHRRPCEHPAPYDGHH